MNKVLRQPLFTSEENLRRVCAGLGHELTPDNAAFPFAALVAAYERDDDLAGDASALVAAGVLPPPGESYGAGGKLSLLGRMQVLSLVCTFGDGAGQLWWVCPAFPRRGRHPLLGCSLRVCFGSEGGLCPSPPPRFTPRSSHAEMP